MALIGYQVDAAQRILSRISRGIPAYIEDGERTAVSLSAPTGSGKTIIAAAVIEQLLFGGEGRPGNHRLVVLWVSDSPELNEQTRDKFMAFSPKLTLERLVAVGDDDPLDVGSLRPGRVYFLNTQKLGAGASSYRRGDNRQFDLWETIDGTGRLAGTDFLLIVDEAHRGTGKASSGGGRQTILAQLVKGGDSLAHPAPTVLGISATPQRFLDLVGDDLSVRPVPVDIDQVRASGLVKDQVLLAHPRETQVADATLLTQAAHQRQDMARLWREYTDAEDLAVVDPILLVQVPAGHSEASIGGILDVIFEADTSLNDTHVVHSLESHRIAEFGRHAVRYLEPSSIQDTAGVRVVVFKEALTTGWDCPRAEVLISLRGAQDDTYITQLIGRTVRTPLARRIETVDALNQVWVYLPHFNETTVQRVVARLAKGDDAVAAEVVVNPVLLHRNPDVPSAVWTAFDAFPTNTRPSKTARNDVARAIQLGMLFAGRGVSGVGKSAVENAVASALVEFAARGDVAPGIAAKVTDFESIDYTTLTVDWMTGDVIGSADDSLHVAAGNVADLFAAAKRKLPEGAALWLWNRLCDTQFPDDPDLAKLHTAAVAFHPDAAMIAESTARTLFQNWYKEHLARLVGDREAQARVSELLALSRKSEPTSITTPDKSTATRASDWWDKHLLAARPNQPSGDEGGATYPAGKYPWKPSNSWESRVLTIELARPGVVGWYRNPTSGAQAIGIPYGSEHAQHLTYPDFIIFRDEGDQGIAIDIVDPHRPDLTDTAPKWNALAKWASAVNAGQHGPHRLGRVWAVIEEGGELVFVDLLDTGVAKALAKLDSEGAGESAIRALFAAKGARLEPTS